MKKYFLFVAAATITFSTASAQTEKGARYIGVNLGNLSYEDVDNRSYFSGTLSPNAGVFVADNFLLGSGLEVSYTLQKIKNLPNQDYRGRDLTLGISPFARYYLPGTGPHRFFGQANVGIARSSFFSKQKGIYVEPSGQLIPFENEQRGNSTRARFGVALGYNYFLTPSAALQVIASYNRYGYGGNSSASAGALGVSAGFAVFLPSKGAKAAE